MMLILRSLDIFKVHEFFYLYKQQKGGGKKVYTKSHGTAFGFVLSLIFLTSGIIYLCVLLQEMTHGTYDSLEV